MVQEQTVIVTGASGGIGTGLVKGFLEIGYNVVATALNASRAFSPCPQLAIVDGDIGRRETATRATRAAVDQFGSLDLLVHGAGIFKVKPFTEYTEEDFTALVSTNLLGFVLISQLAVREMMRRKAGHVVSITASLADQPQAGIHASVAMMTKGGLNAIIRSLAIEFARSGIRFNAVAPGAVDTPMHGNESLADQQPMGRPARVQDVVDAVLYLARAPHVTGEVLHVDGGAHAGRW